MKRILQLCFTLAFFALGFSQSLKPVAEKVKQSHTANRQFVQYDFFTVDESVQKKQLYSAAADDITVMKLNTTELQRINTERPEALEMSFPFEGKTITVELVKNNFFTNDFKVNSDKGYIAYAPGVYYYGIVKGDNNSLVSISFFDNDVAGIVSTEVIGNIVLGKVKNSQDFVSYNDNKLKGGNQFSCAADQLPENKNIDLPKYDPEMLKTTMTDNCVRTYYELTNKSLRDNANSNAQTTNWITAIHNNISTLYVNDGITVAVSEIFIWQTQDPYTGDYNANLSAFRVNRPTFNGDFAHLVNTVYSTSVAYLNSLCTASKYAYSGINLGYQNVPTYSWTIMAMTHEMGHALGSPHTHACAWNGNNTAIDGCGPAGGANEGCDAPLPTGGGTIMSYCHLNVGINFTKGFGPQPAALIRNTVNSKPCLGTNCIASCNVTISGLSVSNLTANSITATIADNTATSWKYRLAKMDGTVVQSGVTNTKILNFSSLAQGTYYTIAVGSVCSGPDAFSSQQMILTDADWCSGILFTDSGGATANYGNGQNIVKTFYPANASDKVKMTFTQFDLDAGDFINVFDGPNLSSPRFSNGIQLTGNTVPTPFVSTHASGAITVRFISNASGVKAGWVANLECLTLATNEATLGANINITKTAQSGVFTIVSKDKVLSYKIFDASGKLVVNSANLNSNSENLDLRRYQSGTYVVSVTTVKETVTKKVIR